MQHKTHTSYPRAASQRGASMIELLVSLLIFAFGMLGLVGLQNKTLGYSQISLYRSQATAMAEDILDRMRADRANAKAGTWNSAASVASADITGTATVAETDMKDWKLQVETLLPAPHQASVAVAGGVATITIVWGERGTDTTFTTVSGL